MKTLICINGHVHALRATKLAAKFACATNSEATFLFVRRFRKSARGYNIRRKAQEVFADWREELPEMKYLHQAEDVFKQARGGREKKIQTEEAGTALVHVGGGIFEEGKVYLRSDSQAHLKIREGIPHEEIVEEAREGRYELLMLGAHRLVGCRWCEIENIPLRVAQEAPCPVTVIGEDFEEGQPVLVYVGSDDPPDSTLHLCRVITATMKSEIEVLSVQRTANPAFQYGEKVSSMMDEWSRSSLKVTPRVMAGDPVEVILEMAVHYGLIVCSSGKKRRKNRLGKVTKKVLCGQLNVLITR